MWKHKFRKKYWTKIRRGKKINWILNCTQNPKTEGSPGPQTNAPRQNAAATACKTFATGQFKSKQLTPIPQNSHKRLQNSSPQTNSNRNAIRLLRTSPDWSCLGQTCTWTRRSHTSSCATDSSPATTMQPPWRWVGRSPPRCSKCRRRVTFWNTCRTVWSAGTRWTKSFPSETWLTRGTRTISTRPPSWSSTIGPRIDSSMPRWTRMHMMHTKLK